MPKMLGNYSWWLWIACGFRIGSLVQRLCLNWPVIHKQCSHHFFVVYKLSSFTHFNQQFYTALYTVTTIYNHLFYSHNLPLYTGPTKITTN